MENAEREKLIQRAYRLITTAGMETTNPAKHRIDSMKELNRIKRQLGVKRLRDLPDHAKRNHITGKLER